MKQWEFIDAMNDPAFIVKKGIVVKANVPALQRNIEPDTPVAMYICTGSQDYESFSDGKLSLGLCINTIHYGACVTCVDDCHLFCLDSDRIMPELQAFSLAAQHLREPLSRAMNGAELLLTDLGENDAAKEKLARLNKNLYRLLRVISNMSDAALYQSQQSQNQEFCNISAIAQEIFEKSADLAEKANRKLEYKLPSESIFSLADRQKLERCILNMLSNAWKHSPSESTVLAELKQVDNRIYFTIENALSQDFPNNPFVRYLREPGIACSENGIGLGMAIIQAVAVSHGGTVLIEQTKNNTVKITLTISLRCSSSLQLCSPVLYPIDYTGGMDKALLELCDILPDCLFADKT